MKEGIAKLIISLWKSETPSDIYRNPFIIGLIIVLIILAAVHIIIKKSNDYLLGFGFVVSGLLLISLSLALHDLPHIGLLIVPACVSITLGIGILLISVLNFIFYIINLIITTFKCKERKKNET